jgi:hypothetical protein
MGELDLGETKKVKSSQKKQKVIYLGIPTTIMLMIDIMDCPNCHKYIEALSKSIRSALTNKELRKEIFDMVGVRTVKKMRLLKMKEMALLTSLFDEDIWRD